MFYRLVGPADQYGMISTYQFGNAAQADEHVGFRVTRNSNVYCPALLPIFQQKVERKPTTLAEMSRLKRLPGYLKAADHLFDDPTLPNWRQPRVDHAPKPAF